jgi:hypothetical protein
MPDSLVFKYEEIVQLIFFPLGEHRAIDQNFRSEGLSRNCFLWLAHAKCFCKDEWVHEPDISQVLNDFSFRCVPLIRLGILKVKENKNTLLFVKTVAPFCCFVVKQQ